MVPFRDLTVPLIAAPMAGGPSTPELLAALARAGGMGLLAAGYGPAEAMSRQVAATRALGVERFGVNIFVPDREPADLAAARAYREALAGVAAELGVELGEPRQDDSHYGDKIAAVLADPVPVVSFTFGLPEPGVAAELRERGSAVWVTVTSVRDAVEAVAAGADVLVVQGPEAGGHRSTFTVAETPGTAPLAEVLREVRPAVDVPIVAAGGLTTPQAIADALRVADAAQLGTAYLLADEAGTPAVYRAALQDPAYTGTAVTRALTGRPARSLVNEIIRRFDAVAPAAYPALHHVTVPLRTASSAVGTGDWTALWAGTGWQEAQARPAEEITAGLWSDVAEILGR